MYKTVKTQTNLPVKICHLKVIGLWFAAVDVIKTVESSKICSFSVLSQQ